MLKRFMPWKGKIFDIAPHTPSGIVKEKNCTSSQKVPLMHHFDPSFFSVLF